MAFGSINVPGGWHCTLLARLASLERLLEGLEKLTGSSRSEERRVGKECM